MLNHYDTKSVAGRVVPQYGAGALLVFTLVPGIAMLLLQGFSRLFAGLGGIAASAVYLFAEVALFAALLYAFARREGGYTFRAAIPYQAKCGAVAFLVATGLAALWSIYFRDYFSWQPLTEFSQWARGLAEYWPPDFLEGPPRGLPLGETVAAPVRIGLYSLALVAYGSASAMQTLYFRGFLMARMAYMGWAAPFVNTALFAVFHLASPWFWPQFFLFTLIWGLVTWAVRNVWPAVIGHVIFNTYWFGSQILTALTDL